VLQNDLLEEGQEGREGESDEGGLLVLLRKSTAYGVQYCVSVFGTTNTSYVATN
jgi:hypothetical protein